MGLALLNAAMKHADDKSNPLAEKIGTTIIKNDRPSQPLASGYNRTMCDNIRIK
jgi:hypothetical protein